MSVMEVTPEMLAAKFEAIFPHLDERQRRLLLGAEARALGHGGIRLVARAAGVREATVSLGVDELDSGEEPLGRARRPGGGRKRAAEVDPGLRRALLALVEPDERGDPVSPLRWTAKSTRALADELTARGHKDLRALGCELVAFMSLWVSQTDPAILAGLLAVPEVVAVRSATRRRRHPHAGCREKHPRPAPDHRVDPRRRRRRPQQHRHLPGRGHPLLAARPAPLRSVSPPAPGADPNDPSPALCL
jgi:hypothetical protein